MLPLTFLIFWPHYFFSSSSSCWFIAINVSVGLNVYQINWLILLPSDLRIGFSLFFPFAGQTLESRHRARAMLTWREDFLEQIRTSVNKAWASIKHNEIRKTGEEKRERGERKESKGEAKGRERGEKGERKERDEEQGISSPPSTNFDIANGQFDRESSHKTDLMKISDGRTNWWKAP